VPDKQRRWSELLSKYDFNISYIKGIVNRVANALIRRPCVFSIFPLKMSLQENVLKLQLEDEWYKQFKCELENKLMKKLKYKGFALVMMFY
jgi:hypothetical protein